MTHDLAWSRGTARRLALARARCVPVVGARRGRNAPSAVTTGNPLSCGNTLSSGSRARAASSSQADSAGSIPVTRSLEKPRLTCGFTLRQDHAIYRCDPRASVSDLELFHVCSTPRHQASLAAEQRARVLVDRQLSEAGWFVQSRSGLNLFAGWASPCERRSWCLVTAAPTISSTSISERSVSSSQARGHVGCVDSFLRRMPAQTAVRRPKHFLGRTVRPSADLLLDAVATCPIMGPHTDLLRDGRTWSGSALPRRLPNSA